MPLSPEQLAAMEVPPAAAPLELLATRGAQLLAYITAVNAAAGTGSMRARKLAHGLAGELGYPGPLSGKPAVALEPAYSSSSGCSTGHRPRPRARTG